MIALPFDGRPPFAFGTAEELYEWRLRNGLDEVQIFQRYEAFIEYRADEFQAQLRFECARARKEVARLFDAIRVESAECIEFKMKMKRLLDAMPVWIPRGSSSS